MEYKFCKDKSVECQFHEKGLPCSECVDITEATNFLLKTLNPKSGTLQTGVMNNDYAAYLITIFSKQFEEKIDFLNTGVNVLQEEIDRLKIFAGFWERLLKFVENVQVNDQMSEEEKGMIINICKAQNLLN